MRKLFILVVLLPLIASAQKLPGISEKINNLKKYEGYFNFYLDENTGKTWLEIDKPDTEFLYVTSLPAGLGSNDIGLDRGRLGESRIVKFSRVGNKVLLIQPNYDYRAISDDAAERRAVEQAFAQSTIAGFSVEAESNGSVLIDITDFLLRDAMNVSQTIKRMKQGNYAPDKSRSVMYLPNTRNFPQNTELEATITYVNNDGETGGFVRSVTPSTEAITLRIHHSFVQLPDDNYTPRIFDPRSSFIPISFYDYASPISEPVVKYYVRRHRLQKKDPTAAKSEPVKPIVYYLDNGTPEPVRSALLDGARWWNQAFEVAGYANAFRVEVLPDTADPMDIRYNMINWVHRSTRGWSYGASVTDPRTGEIIKGQVTLGSLRVRQDYLIFSGLLSPYETGIPADNPMQIAALARLRQLSAHEIGHTLGLMHNYAASVSNRASVMDYPHPTIRLNAAGEMDFSDVYDDKIGEWDKVAIAWGYQHFPPGTSESAALNTILQDAHKKGLQFIADRDARAPGGLHPQAHLWDNGVNAAEELKEVMKVRRKALQQFGEKNILPGTPMAMLEDALVPVYFYHRYQVEAAAKVVGGMYYTYALRNDGQIVTQPVSKQEQSAALQALTDCIDPGVLQVPDHIAALIPPRPAGYGNSGELFRKRTGLSFDQLSPAETAADLPFSFLFNPERLSRMLQLETKGGLGIEEMLQVLLNKTWKAKRQNGMQALIQQQTEQVLLTYLLAASVDENNAFGVRGIFTQSLQDLKKYIEEQAKTAKGVYAGHLQLALERMKTPKDAKPTIHKEIPPGAPIGCDEGL